jgi:hypothetical protein
MLANGNRLEWSPNSDCVICLFAGIRSDKNARDNWGAPQSRNYGESPAEEVQMQ